MREPAEPVGVISDPFGDMVVRPGDVPSSGMVVEVLARIPTREELEGTLQGWQRMMPEAGSLNWAKERLREGSRTADAAGPPSTEGERTLPPE
jgi:hypothetical protein